MFILKELCNLHHFSKCYFILYYTACTDSAALSSVVQLLTSWAPFKKDEYLAKLIQLMAVNAEINTPLNYFQ